MKKVLVVASTFPRWQHDTTPGFVFDLTNLLAKKFSMRVLVPHYHKAKKYEKIGNVVISRFQYFYPAKYQRLCYNGGILPNIKKSFLAKIQVPFFLLSEFFHIKKILKKEKISTIHAHWILPQGFLGVVFKKIYKIPLIITVHAGDIFPLNNRFLKKIAKFSLDNCDYCTVNSTATKKAVLEISNRIRDIRIIPMGVDLRLFNPNKKNKSIKNKLKIKKQVLLTVGRLAEKKGFKYLIKAMPAVLKKFPEAKLIIVGSGPEKEDLIKLSNELKINKNIIFTGELQNKILPEYYATADVFILPSIITKTGDTEGLGVVLLEAIASGTAVIGSGVGGIPDIIKNGKTGLLVKQKNPGELAKAIIKLLSDNNLRKRLIKNGQRHIVEGYSWDKVSRKFYEIYNKLVLK